MLALALVAMAAMAQNRYVVTGSCEGIQDGDTVFICDMQGFFAFVPIDTTLAKDGRFTFEGEVESTGLRYVVPIKNNSQANYGIADFFLSADSIDVCMYDENKHIKPVVSYKGEDGKLWNVHEAMNDYWYARQAPSWDIVREKRGTEAQQAAAKDEMDAITAKMEAAELDFVMRYAPSPVCDYIFAGMYERTRDEAKRNELYEAYAPSAGAGYHFNAIKQRRDAEKRTAVGSKFTDLEMPAPNGKMLKASTIVKKNKYTLIDFWASWCGPCRAEMPNVVKAYNTFHKKGFDVVGVSFDNNKAAWLKAIPQLKMPWPQMSDLKGWQCAAASLYNISGIPANVLVDQNGIIVAKNLRGEDLLSKLAELMK